MAFLPPLEEKFPMGRNYNLVTAIPPAFGTVFGSKKLLHKYLMSEGTETKFQKTDLSREIKFHNYQKST